MRTRIYFSKTGNLRYTSILDVQKIWERAARRANLCMQYSQGFHPQAKIQVANPLPLGYLGLNELVDLWIEAEMPAEEIKNALNKALPTGIAVLQVDIMPDNSPSLPKQVLYSDYKIHFFDNVDTGELNLKIEDLLAKESVMRIRNSKSYDLRPLITNLNISQAMDDKVQIDLRMPSSPAKTGRPEEVLFELGFEWSDFSIERTRLILAEQSE